MKKLVLCALSVLSVSAHAVLDKIDADGVTEKGGSSAYARMIPRTGASGLIDTSLLPPVADWASRPIGGLYYLSGGSTEQGNGSPQYPFRTLDYAMSHVTNGATIVVAPYTYSGSASFRSGMSLTLSGYGYASRISSLSISVSGESADTMLVLIGVTVNELNIIGGRISVRMLGSTVSKLSGTSIGVTVVREDMGSRVISTEIQYTSRYTGYDTAPRARGLISDGRSSSVILSGRKMELTDGEYTDTVAYMSDISAATSSVSAAIHEIRATNQAMAVMLAYEGEIRAGCDAVLSNKIDATEAAIKDRIDGVGKSWSDQLSTVSWNITRLGESVSAVYAKETNDVECLSLGISSVRSEYINADTYVKTELYAAISDSVSSLRADVSGIADARFVENMKTARTGIVEEAIARSGTNSSSAISKVYDEVLTNRVMLGSVELRVSEHDTSLAGLSSAVDSAVRSIDSLSDKEERDIDRISSSMTGIEDRLVKADAQVSRSMSVQISAVSNSIPTTAYKQAERAIADKRSGIISEAVRDARDDLSSDIGELASCIAVVTRMVGDVETSVSGYSSRIGSLENKTGTLTSSLSSLEEKVRSNKETTDESIKSLTSAINEMSARVKNIERLDDNIKSKIEQIIDALVLIKKGRYGDITIPTKDW